LRVNSIHSLGMYRITGIPTGCVNLENWIKFSK